MKIYPTVHVSKLKKYYDKLPEMEPQLYVTNIQDEYEVEEIQGEKEEKYLVK
jgi:hypothetical protein